MINDSPPKTVCAKCQHPIRESWCGLLMPAHDWLCRVRKVKYDTVTGGSIFRPCQEVNDGFCPQFEAKP